MEEKRINHFKLTSFFTLWRLAAFVLLGAVSLRFSLSKQYNQMALMLFGALFGPAQWVYLRDQLKGTDDELDLVKANRWLIFILCVCGSGIAYLYNNLLIASLTIVAGFGQFWFKYDITASERIWHGFSATGLAILGFFKYTPLMFICLPLSIIFMLHQIHLFKKEKQQRKEEIENKKNKSGKKKKKKRKKK